MATIDEVRQKTHRGPTVTEYVLTAALIAIVLYSLYTTLTGHGG